MVRSTMHLWKSAAVFECVNDIIDGSIALIFDDDKTAVTFEIKIPGKGDF